MSIASACGEHLDTGKQQFGGWHIERGRRGLSSFGDGAAERHELALLLENRAFDGRLEIPDAGHHVMLDQPLSLVELLRDLLR